MENIYFTIKISKITIKILADDFFVISILCLYTLVWYFIYLFVYILQYTIFKYNFSVLPILHTFPKMFHTKNIVYRSSFPMLLLFRKQFSKQHIQKIFHQKPSHTQYCRRLYL